jgi:hypothetical protein
MAAASPSTCMTAKTIATPIFSADIKNHLTLD